MRIEAIPSHTEEPVAGADATPTAANARPSRAAESSKSTLFTVGSSESFR